MHPKIFITANIVLKENAYNFLKARIIIIINFDIIIWHIKLSKKKHITYKNDKRILVYLIKKNAQIITIGYVYLPVII